MRLPWARPLAAGLLAAGSTVLLAPAGASAAGSSLTVQASFGAETWYQQSPTCATPAGCPPANNPYGAGTLHVAVTAGAESARSYLTVRPVTASGGAVLTGAVVTVPLDTATPGNGSLMPDTATIRVCISTGTVAADEGSYDAPPPTNCSDAPVLAYAATPAPMLTADLAPLLATLARDLPTGVALALLPGAPAMTDSWHVVFSGVQRASPPTPPAALALTYTAPGSVAPVQVAPSAAPAVATPPAAASAPVPGASGSVRAAVSPTAARASRSASPAASRRPSSRLSPSAAPSVPAAPPAAPPVVVVQPAPAVLPMVVVTQPSAEPLVAAPAPSLAPSVAPSPAADPSSPAAAPPAAPLSAATVASRTVTTGFAYPVVVLLPLLLVGGGVVLARIMTQDVAPPVRGGSAPGP